MLLYSALSGTFKFIAVSVSRGVAPCFYILPSPEFFKEEY
jgi:hypothetical protein